MSRGGAPSFDGFWPVASAVLGPFHFPVWCNGNMYSDLGSLANRLYRHPCWRSVQPRSHCFSFRWTDNTFTPVSGQGSHGHLRFRPPVAVPGSSRPSFSRSPAPQPPTPTFPGLARLRPSLPARLVFAPSPSQVLLPLLPGAHCSFAVVLLLRPSLMLTSLPVLLPSRSRARLFCPVPSCPGHSLPSHGWATFSSMRPHSRCSPCRAAHWRHPDGLAAWTGLQHL